MLFNLESLNKREAIMNTFGEVFCKTFKGKFYYFLTAVFGAFAIQAAQDFVFKSFYFMNANQRKSVTMIFFILNSLWYFFASLVLVKQEMFWRDKPFLSSYREGKLSFKNFFWGNISSSAIYFLILIEVPWLYDALTRALSDPSKTYSAKLVNPGVVEFISALSNFALLIVGAIVVHILGWKLKKALNFNSSLLSNIVYYSIFVLVMYVLIFVIGPKFILAMSTLFYSITYSVLYFVYEWGAAVTGLIGKLIALPLITMLAKRLLKRYLDFEEAEIESANVEK